jgi:tRNA (guanine37-N1)-methyltransferase
VDHAVARQPPGALGDEQSAAQESFVDGLLIALTTRGPGVRGERVPEVLLSGHHAEIERWR